MTRILVHETYVYMRESVCSIITAYIPYTYDSLDYMSVYRLYITHLNYPEGG